MPRRVAKIKDVRDLKELLIDQKKGRHTKELYTRVLKLLKLEARKFELLLELVRSLAHKEMEEEAGITITTDNHEELILQHIPWALLPDLNRCETSRGQSTKERQRTRVLQQLRNQVETLNKTLGRIVDKDTGAPLASGE